MKYTVNYNTGIIEEIEGELHEVMEAVDDGAAYTQQDVVIYNDLGNEVARRRWWGTELDPEYADGDEITFGDFGHYTGWEDTWGLYL